LQQRFTQGTHSQLTIFRELSQQRIITYHFEHRRTILTLEKDQIGKPNTTPRGAQHGHPA
jgi:hypothetical protein